MRHPSVRFHGTPPLSQGDAAHTKQRLPQTSMDVAKKNSPVKQCIWRPDGVTQIDSGNGKPQKEKKLIHSPHQPLDTTRERRDAGRGADGRTLFPAKSDDPAAGTDKRRRSFRPCDHENIRRNAAGFHDPESVFDRSCQLVRFFIRILITLIPSFSPSPGLSRCVRFCVLFLSPVYICEIITL